MSPVPRGCKADLNWKLII